MSGAIPPFPQYALMAWCSVKAQGLNHIIIIIIIIIIVIVTAVRRESEFWLGNLTESAHQGYRTV
jgi:flagellar basal body-associated protein FliL